MRLGRAQTDCVNSGSQHKFYGPHLGVLCRTSFVRGKYDLLDRLQAYKVRPAPDDPPGKADRLRPSETGTHPSGTTKVSPGRWRR